MTPAPADVAAVLEEAVGVLAERGWRQGPRDLAGILAGLSNGPVSVGHAILIATPHPDMTGIHDAAVYALAEWIGEHPDSGPVSWRDAESLAVDVDAWNDAPDRTIADVVCALRGASRLVMTP